MGALLEVSIQVTEAGKNRPEYTLDSDLNGEVTLKDFLEWTKSVLIVTADTVLKDEKSMGFDKDPVVLIDGRRTKNPNAVHPLGQIEFFARQAFGAILIEAYEALLSRSKVRTGRYKEHHYVFHNGKQVAVDLGSLKAWLISAPEFKDNDTVRIVNIQPYARRLETLGVTAQRSNPVMKEKRRKKGQVGPGIGLKIPNGTYALSVRSLKSKYKQNVSINFNLISGGQLGIPGSFKTGKKGSIGRPYLYPSIVFRIRESGIL